MTDECRFANSLFIISKNKDFVGLKKLYTENTDKIFNIILKYNKLKNDFMLQKTILLNFDVPYNIELLKYYTSIDNYELLLILISRNKSYYDESQSVSIMWVRHDIMISLKHIFSSKICVLQLLQNTEFKQSLESISFYKKMDLFKIGLSHNSIELDRKMIEIFNINVNKYFINKFQLTSYPRLINYMKLDWKNLGNENLYKLALNLITKIVKNSDIANEILVELLFDDLSCYVNKLPEEKRKKFIEIICGEKNGEKNRLVV